MGKSAKETEYHSGHHGWYDRLSFNKNEAEESFSFGFIDEVSVYDRTLSADEVKQNYDTDTQATAVESAGKLALTWGGIKLSR